MITIHVHITTARDIASPDEGDALALTFASHARRTLATIIRRASLGGSVIGIRSRPVEEIRGGTTWRFAWRFRSGPYRITQARVDPRPFLPQAPITRRMRRKAVFSLQIKNYPRQDSNLRPTV